jgi:hypothetical protein
MKPDVSERAGFVRHLPHVPWGIAVGLLAGAAAVLAYLAARVALEIVLGLVACALLVLVQRTVADSLRDLFGAATVNVVMAGVLLAAGWYVFGSESGSDLTRRGLAEAERRGFRTAMIDVSGVAAPQPRVSVPPSTRGGTGSAGPGGGPAAAGGAPTVRQPALAGDSNRTPGRTPPEPAPTSAARPRSPSPAPAADRPPASAAARSGAPAPTSGSGAAASGNVAPAGGGEAVARRSEARPAVPEPAVLRIEVAPKPQVAGQPLTISVEASAAPEATPAGDVELTLNGVLVGKESLGSTGRAEFTLLNLAAGRYRITARLLSKEWVAREHSITVTVASQTGAVNAAVSLRRDGVPD